MQSFKYDPNGNMTLHDKPEAQTHYYWDEANRMRVVQQEDQMHHYIYDAAGERVLKSKTNIQEVYENGTLMNSTAEIENYTTYPSPLLTINPEGNYTKHYFAGTQRIASKTMAQSIDNNLPQTPESPSLQQQQQAQQTDLENYLKQANIKNYSFAKATVTTAVAAPEGSLYYFHPDHLGTATFLTDNFGNPYQLFLNLPFGESMAEQRLEGSLNNVYKFNGKELDVDTGLYNYGARYYNPSLSIWASVDPLAEKFPNVNPYVYCVNNPVNMIDIDGLYPIYILVRSYAPFQTFGPYFNWHGDGRGHTLNINASFRSATLIRYDTEKNNNRVSVDGWKSRSFTIDGKKDAISRTSVFNRSESNNIDVHSKAGNAAQFGAQPIDQFSKLSVDIKGNLKKDHILNIKGTISGDDFPNQESIMYDSFGNGLWLGNYETKGDRENGPVFDLFFENEGDVNINIDISVKVNKEGKFIGVMIKDKEGKERMISIQEWNKKFKSDDNK